MIPGIFIAAFITALLIILLIGSFVFRRSTKKEYLLYVLLFLATLPMSYLSTWYIRLPFDQWFQTVMMNHTWYVFLTNFYAPLIEEPAKLWPLLIPFFYRKVTKENALKVALSLGLGFGVGELWFLAWRLSLNAQTVSVPWYQFSGFINERFLVCILHGAFTAVTVYIWKKYNTRAGIIGSMFLHFLVNFPIYVSGIDPLHWGKTTWQYILSLYVPLYTFLMIGMMLFFQFRKNKIMKFKKIFLAPHVCPECGKEYRGRWLALNSFTKAYEKCPFCKKWHWVPYVQKKDPTS